MRFTSLDELLVLARMSPVASFRFSVGLVVLLMGLAQSAASVTAPRSADTVVLVNSASGRYLEFRNYIQPYLDHFGIPYSVLDVRTNEIGTNIADSALIVIGHAQLDTNHVYFSPTEQSNVVDAVVAGTGLVNFDSVLSGSGVVTNYQYVQDIFGFSYPGGSTGNFIYSAGFFATEPTNGLHYIVTRHPTNSEIAFRMPISLLRVDAPAGVKVLSRAGGQPMIAVRSLGDGRAVHWGSYDWMNTEVKGPLGGMDDLIWRGLVWAARKPFFMRGMPPMVSMRVDDTVGPSWWVGVANEVGIKPWLGPFISAMPSTNIPELRLYATNGLCTVSPHSFYPGDFIYWNHNANTNWSNVEISNRMYRAQGWHVTNEIPMAKVIVPHSFEVGANAFPWFKMWGVEFFTLDNAPNTPMVSPWLVAGPFRKNVPTRLTNVLIPVCYSDFLNIPGYPELAGQFFDSLTVIQDDAACAEWCPNNDVTNSVAKGVRQLTRAFDSMAPGTLYTHEAYIQYNAMGPVYTPSITTNNFRTILRTITNQIAAYQPRYVTLDYSCQYDRASRTAIVKGAGFDPTTGQMSLSMTGRSDLELTGRIYLGEDSAITNVPAFIPAFTNEIVVVTQVTIPPAVPPLLSGEIQEGLFTLMFTTTPARQHWVEYCSELDQGEWIVLTNFTATTTNAVISDAVSPSGRLYRVRISEE